MKTRTVAGVVTLSLATGCNPFGPDNGEVTVSGAAFLDGVPLLEARGVSGLQVYMEFTGPPDLQTRGFVVIDVASSRFTVVAEIPSADCQYVNVLARSQRMLIADPWGPFPGYPADSSAGYWLPCRDTTYTGLDFHLIWDTMSVCCPGSTPALRPPTGPPLITDSVPLRSSQRLSNTSSLERLEGGAGGSASGPKPGDR